MSSSKQKLTKRLIDSLQPHEKRYVVWDDQITGYGIRVYPTGRKMFFIQYRNRNSELRWFNLGQPGHITPEQAREAAKKELGNVANGHDPSQDKQLKLKEMSISELCDLYLSEGCKHKKPSTVQTDKGRIEWHIKPLLGKKKITAVKRADIEKMKHDIAEGKTQHFKKTKKHGRAVVTGGQGAASRTVSLLSTIYGFAINRDLIQDNPCRGIKKFTDKKCERFLSPQEFLDLGDALKELEASEHSSALNIIKLLVLTGCRKGEIQTLKWDYVDLERSVINLPDSKTGQKIIRLGPPAIEVLKGLKRMQGNNYVFFGEKDQHYFVGLPKVWQRIKNLKPSLHDVRLHDLRHSFASVGVRHGYNLMIVGSLLGHTNPETTARYAHLANDPLREAVDSISSNIQKSMSR